MPPNKSEVFTFIKFSKKLKMNHFKKFIFKKKFNKTTFKI